MGTKRTKRVSLGGQPERAKRKKPSPLDQHFVRLAAHLEDGRAIQQALVMNQYFGTIARSLFWSVLLTKAEVEAAEEYAAVCGRYSRYFGSDQLRTPKSPAFVKAYRDEKIAHSAEDQQAAAMAKLCCEKMMKALPGHNRRREKGILDRVCVFDQEIHEDYHSELKILLARLVKHFRIKDRGVQAIRDVGKLMAHALRDSRAAKAGKPRSSSADDLEPVAHRKGYITRRDHKKRTMWSLFVQDECGETWIFKDRRGVVRDIMYHQDEQRCYRKNLHDLKRLLARERGYAKRLSKAEEHRLDSEIDDLVKASAAQRRREIDKRLNLSTRIADIPQPKRPRDRLIAACGILKIRLKKAEQEDQETQVAHDGYTTIPLEAKDDLAQDPVEAYVDEAMFTEEAEDELAPQDLVPADNLYVEEEPYLALVDLALAFQRYRRRAAKARKG